VADDKKPEDMSDKEYLEWKKRRRAERQWKELQGQAEKGADDERKEDRRREKSITSHLEDVLGDDLKTVEYEVSMMEEGKEKREAQKALEEVRKAMKGGWFSRANPEHVKRVAQQNQGKLAKRKKGWLDCAVIGVIGLGVATLEAAVIGAGLHDLVSGVLG